MPAEELQVITQALLSCGADIVEINTIRKRLSAVKGGRFALACAPAAVYSVVLSDILGDPLDMIASGPACPDSSTCAQAAAIAEKYRLALSPAAAALLRQETPKTLPNVTTKITGSVRELCRAAADACRAEGYEPVLLTDCLCCEAREAGSLLGSIARTHAGQGRKRAFIAGGETVVHLTGHGLGGRNQELALAAAPALAGLRGCCVFSVGSDGTDGPTIKKIIGSESYELFTVMTSDDLIAQNPELVQKAVNAMTKAIQWMQTASAEEIAQNLLPLFDGAEEELQYDASYDKEHHVYTTDGYHTESGYEAAITLTKLAGGITKDLPADQTYDESFLANAWETLNK